MLRASISRPSVSGIAIIPSCVPAACAHAPPATGSSTPHEQEELDRIATRRRDPSIALRMQPPRCDDDERELAHQHDAMRQQFATHAHARERASEQRGTEHDGPARSGRREQAAHQDRARESRPIARGRTPSRASSSSSGRVHPPRRRPRAGATRSCRFVVHASPRVFSFVYTSYTHAAMTQGHRSDGWMTDSNT